MRSSDFAPLAAEPAADAGFRPLPTRGTGDDAVAPAAPPPPDPVEVARAEGHAAGFAAGRAARDAEIAALHAEVRSALAELTRFRADVRGRWERELLQLSLGIARKVVLHEVAERPEIWLGMIRAAVRQMVDREQLVVRVPPTLAKFLREADPPLASVLEGVRELEIVEDAGLPEGGCVVESRFGDVDCGVDTQLATCRQAILDTDK